MEYKVGDKVRIHELEIFSTFDIDRYGTIWTINRMNIITDMHQYFGKEGIIYASTEGSRGTVYMLNIDGKNIVWWWCDACFHVKKGLFEFKNLIIEF